MMQTSPILFDANVANQIFVLRFGSNEYKQYADILDSYQKWLIELVSDNYDDLQTVTGTKRLIRLANRELESRLGVQLDLFQDTIAELAEQQTEFVEKALNRAVDEFEALTPDLKPLLNEINRTPLNLGYGAFQLDEYLGEIVEKTTENVKNTLFLGYSSGYTLNQLISEIRNDKRNGIPASKLDVERVVRTSINHIATTARQKTYKANKNLIIGYRWLATLDNRTSAICRARDQEVFLYENDPNPLPPAHPFCRSTTEAVFGDNAVLKGVLEDGTRASKGAEGGQQVDGNISYYDWLKNQPASFVDEALGKTMGLIFRNSGLTPDEFKKASLSRLGKPLTIAQLRDKNAVIDQFLAKYD